MDRVAQAFAVVGRVHFLPPELQNTSYIDAPLPIGYGQTNSQPSTVRMMLEWLEVQPADRVLDVGSGSGWTSALLSHLAGPKGKVYAVEKIPELVEFGRRNARRFGSKNVKFFPAQHIYGLPEYAPYDRILVSASAQELPTELLDQLKPGGKLVVPVGHDILEINKGLDGSHNIIKHHGFAFVPLIKDPSQNAHRQADASVENQNK